MLEGVAGDSFGQPSPAHRQCRFVRRSDTVGVPSVGASGCMGYDQLDAAEPCSHLNGCHLRRVNGYLGPMRTLRSPGLQVMSRSDRNPLALSSRILITE